MGATAGSDYPGSIYPAIENQWKAPTPAVSEFRTDRVHNAFHAAVCYGSLWMTEAPKKRPRGRPKGAKNRTLETADTSMRDKATSVRIDEALRRVVEGWSRKDAAEFCGVNVRTLYRHQAKRELREADIEARSEQARLASMSPEQRAQVESDKERAARFAAEREAASQIRVSHVLDDQHKRVPTDIVEFYDRYFGGLKCRQHLVHHELPPFHAEMMRKIVDPDRKRQIFNLPYGHSKSTCGTLITSLHAIAHDPNVQLGVGSATSRLAERFVFQIREFLTNPRMYEGSEGDLIEDAGPFVDGVGRLGNNTEFRVSSRESVDKDPTVAAYGYGQEIQSTRLDRLILDDFATRKNHRTPERINQMAEDITQDYVSRLDENGQLILIGTRVKPGDVYSHLEVLPAFEVTRYPCILDYDKGLTLWPDHFDYEAAMRQKGTMRADLFELVYQNSTFFADGGTWSQEQLEACYDNSRVIGQLPPTPVQCFIGLDPAGDGPQSGYTALVLVAVERATGMRHLVDLVNHKAMKASQMKSQVLDWCSRYPVHTFAYENKNLQKQIFAYDLEFRQRLTQYGTRMSDRVRTHSGSGVGGKYDPQWGIEAMSTPFHNRLWTLPWGRQVDVETRRRVGELTEQLMRFPMEGAPTDLMMALWIAETEILLHLTRGRRKLYTDVHREEGLPEDVEARRRVHSRGETREVRPSDFGRGVYHPGRMVNVSEATEREILDALR